MTKNMGNPETGRPEGELLRDFNQLQIGARVVLKETLYFAHNRARIKEGTVLTRVEPEKHEGDSLVGKDIVLEVEGGKVRFPASVIHLKQVRSGIKIERV